MIFKKLRRIFSQDTDKVVGEINEQNARTYKEAAQSASRHKELLEENGITYQIFIATGGHHATGGKPK